MTRQSHTRTHAHAQPLFFSRHRTEIPFPRSRLRATSRFDTKAAGRQAARVLVSDAEKNKKTHPGRIFPPTQRRDAGYVTRSNRDKLLTLGDAHHQSNAGSARQEAILRRSPLSLGEDARNLEKKADRQINKETNKRKKREMRSFEPETATTAVR